MRIIADVMLQLNMRASLRKETKTMPRKKCLCLTQTAIRPLRT